MFSPKTAWNTFTGIVEATGGNIRNIAIASAFLAAQDGGSITMKNIIRATKREFQKMGKLCTETDFAEYYEMIKG